MANKYGGYTGYGLRVNLTTRKITREDTFERYLDVIGGTGIGYKVIWEEVPAGTQAFDEANKVIFSVGPLAGTGALCSGRSTVTSILPTVYPKHLVGSGHMGGTFAPKLKYAGFDFLIVEGVSDRPVWLYIHNGKAELRDASHLWGQGIHRTYHTITQEIGTDSSVACIGPAGENLQPMSVVVNQRSHIAGAGLGAVMGHKKLKAIGICGDMPVHIAGDKDKWRELVNYHRSIIGANNQHVVPNFPSPLFEYYDPGSRWVGAPGKRWGAAEPPVVLTDDVRSLNRIAYRTNNAVYFLGEDMWKYTVRTNGCHACPVRCYTIIRDDKTAAKYGINPVTQNTCVGLFYGRNFFPKLANQKNSEPVREACLIAVELMDDLGAWCNYGQLQRDFLKLYTEGYFQKVLGSDEYKSIPWQKVADSDPSFLFDIIPRIAHKQGEFGTALGMSTPYLLDRWNIPQTEWTKDKSTAYWKYGHPKHHANEDDGQSGVVINTQYNRDPMCHSTCNFVRSGLPIAEQKRLAAIFWGSEDAVDAIGDYKPTNKYKMIRTKWSLIRKELHDTLSLCNWMGPWVTTTNQKNKYVGDDTLESKLYSHVTGHKLNRDELDLVGERIFTYHRAITMRDMNEMNMRKTHDLYPEWIFHDAKGKEPFTKGTIRMDEQDIQKSLDLFYEVMGWDKETGAPKAAAYKRLGMEDVAKEMADKKLIPNG